MRRWNGWGDASVDHPVPERAMAFLEAAVGPGERPHDAALADVLAMVPAPVLPAHPLVATGAEERLRHALGQSLGDWIRLRSGTVPAYPDGVAFPESDGDVREILRWAGSVGARVIPYGGGTSVVGHLAVLPEYGPVISVDMSRLSRMVALDATSHLAVFEAGVQGPDLEAALRAHGFMLGHYPQSFEYSTLGGWIATRSAGQQALGYGRIEDVFAGGHLETPAGPFDILPLPASAAGPDLRHLVLGSEGRAGILTRAVVRVRPVPAVETFCGVFFPGFDEGMEAARELVQARLPLSMVRLSTPRETQSNLVMAGHERLLGLLSRWLALWGAGEGKCMAILGFFGSRGEVRRARRAALGVAAAHRGVYAGQTFGRQWMKQRFRTPYLRNTLWERGYAVDTVETAATWERVDAVVEGMERALERALLDEGERVFTFTHLSHLYPSGSNVYTTYLFRLHPDPEVSLHRWERCKEAVSRAIVDAGGTISHQHGVGVDHRPYLVHEKGALGMEAIRGALRPFDPGAVLNPGKLT